MMTSCKLNKQINNNADVTYSENRRKLYGKPHASKLAAEITNRQERII